MADTTTAETTSHRTTTDGGNAPTPRFHLTDYPEVLRRTIATAHEARGTKTIEQDTHLVGLTTDGVAVYFDEADAALLEVVPAHSDRHDTTDATSPVRDETIDARLGAPAQQPTGAFHTLPNGDHLAIINRESWQRPHLHNPEPPAQYTFLQLATRYTDSE